MKEVRAYVKLANLEQVVAGLMEAGTRCMTTVDVAGLGNFLNPDEGRSSMEFVQKSSKLAKMELARRDDQANRVVEIIQERACTRSAGDGIIFVTDLRRAIKIRTAEEGADILQT